MFGLHRRRLAVSSLVHHARPFLERLEDRCSPANLSLNIAYGTQHTVTLSGQLTGAPTNANQMVKFSGVVSGQTMTDQNGNYSINLNASALGNLNASAINPLNNQSEAQAAGTLVDNGPVISNFHAQEQGQLVVFTGTVTDNWNPQSWPVYLSGDPALKGVYALVDGNGNFTISVDFNTSNYSFTATAQATDSWQELSNQATTLVQIT